MPENSDIIAGDGKLKSSSFGDQAVIYLTFVEFGF